MRLAGPTRLVPAEMMGAANLKTRLAELVMHQLAPCDLGDGIEVVHEVERLEIEMECDLGDDAAAEEACLREASDPDKTLEIDREAIEALVESDRTHELVRFSAPYERIEIELDAKAFLRATIEEAKALSAASPSAEFAERARVHDGWRQRSVTCPEPSAHSSTTYRIQSALGSSLSLLDPVAAARKDLA